MYEEMLNPARTMTERFFEIHHTFSPWPPAAEFHQHPFFEIFFLLSGNVDYIIEGRSYNLRPGDILLTGSSDIHCPDIHPGRPYERIVIWLADDFFGYLQNILGEDLAACFTDAARRDYRLIRPDSQNIMNLKHLCIRITEAMHSNEMGHAALSYAYLTEFLVQLGRAYYDMHDSAKKYVIENENINQVLQYINEHLTENLSLDHLAGRFYISKFHLSRKFKQFTGLSLYQYIMKKRLITARNLLRSGRPVMEACLQCGFNDYSNFLKAFKREFGKNPSEYFRR